MSVPLGSEFQLLYGTRGELSLSMEVSGKFPPAVHWLSVFLKPPPCKSQSCIGWQEKAGF